MAHKYFAQMEAAGFRQDLPAYRSVILACSQTGDVNQARDYMKQMAEKGVLPDRDVFNTLLTTYARSISKAGKQAPKEVKKANDKWSIAEKEI